MGDTVGVPLWVGHLLQPQLQEIDPDAEPQAMWPCQDSWENGLSGRLRYISHQMGTQQWMVYKGTSH